MRYGSTLFGRLLPPPLLLFVDDDCFDALFDDLRTEGGPSEFSRCNFGGGSEANEGGVMGVPGVLAYDEGSEKSEKLDWGVKSAASLFSSE